MCPNLRRTPQDRRRLQEEVTDVTSSNGMFHKVVQTISKKVGMDSAIAKKAY